MAGRQHGHGESARARSRCYQAHSTRGPAGDHRELEQPALERAVEERRLARDLEVNELGQAQVAGEEVRGPARRSAASARRPAADRARRAAPGRPGARRTADWRAGCRSDAGAARASKSACSTRDERVDLRGAQVRQRLRDGAVRDVAREDRRRRRRDGLMRSRAACFMRCHAGPSNHASFWKPNVRARPGARSAAISAASTTIVPLPHIGSSNGDAGRPSGERERARPRGSRAAAPRRCRADSRA